VVEADAGAVPVEACDGRGDHAEITGYRLDSVTLRVTAACPGLLVLTDTYFPGWQATVDGRGAPVVATDLALRGVPVPAGTSTVVFRFRPAPLRLGVLLALLAAIGIIVLGVLHRWLWPRWQGRRAGRAVES
jgi:uncharacterized membrane protein YfhO